MCHNNIGNETAQQIRLATRYCSLMACQSSVYALQQGTIGDMAMRTVHNARLPRWARCPPYTHGRQMNSCCCS